MRFSLSFVFSAALIALAPASAQAPTPAPFLPGIVSTADSEVRITASPDGSVMLWGHIGAGGRLTILMRRRTAAGWSAPEPAPFVSNANDFDPAFAPDGRSLLFFSNRPGGYGKDDIWQADYDARAQTFGRARNLGPAINGAGSEWAPALTRGGALLFSSDGHGGAGRQDMFLAQRRDGAWHVRPVPGAVNTAEDEFDATIVGEAIVFARGNADDGPVRLHIARKRGRGYAAGRPLGTAVNCSDFVIGPSTLSGDPGGFYLSARCPGGAGRMDIWRVDRAALR
jgi:hypothetical protein